VVTTKTGFAVTQAEIFPLWEAALDGNSKLLWVLQYACLQQWGRCAWA